jgi:hypothetical protein
MSQFKALNQASITIEIFLFQVTQKPPSLTDHFQKTSTGMKIFRVYLQVFRQLPHPFGQNSNLNFGGSGVRLMSPVSRHNFLFLFLADQTHHLYRVIAAKPSRPSILETRGLAPSWKIYYHYWQ